MTGFFSSYVSSVLTACIFAFICENLCTHFGKTKTLKNVLGLITSLCIFLTVSFPIINLFSGLSSFIGKSENKHTEATQYDGSRFYSLVKSELEKELAYEIYEKTGIQAISVSIDLSVSDNTVLIKSVTVSAENIDQESKQMLCSIIEQSVGTDTEIIFSGASYG